MKRAQIRDFTQGNITSQLITFAWPLFLSNLLQVFYNMVDMIIVGRVLGKAGTSAVAVGGDISHFLAFIAMGFSSAGQVLIAKYVGSKQTEKLGRFVGTMGGFLAACAIVGSILGLTFQNDILRLMNTPAESYDGAVAYSAVCMIGLIFIYGYNSVSAILRGMGDSQHPFLFIAIAALLNVILDIVFVVILDIGPGGAALATVISQAVSFLCCLFFLARNRERFHLNIQFRDFLRWDKDMLSSLLKLGIPMAIKTASIQTSKLFVNSWINSYGVSVSAFAGIAAKVSSVANLVSNAMNTAGATMIGQNLAAKEFDRVKKIMAHIATITLSIAFLFSAIMLLAPNLIFGFFTTDPDVLSIADGYRYIAVLLFLASAMRAVMSSLINGSGNYRINFVTAILDGIVLRIGLSVLFGLVFDMKHYGFWLGDALAGFTPFWIGLVFFLTGSWKKPVK